ncbi:hypothetical protein CGZ94_19125 [Enemella evansiae]|uniref:GAF domain-containing protein n=1 Tax=Enemella evansiae TaxID=2016499 RepID=A0A255FY88_9ACTN|nr:GAF domain-containing protein [Enemella evansiae]OYO08639.1 hypothetical protein CGZ94_19125 [Enemella evansiae]
MAVARNRASAPRMADPDPDALAAALEGCAVDMSSIRDSRLVLQAVVRRTRTLLGADMAYLSRNDLVAGETWIELWDGVRTAAYQNIRMPLGTGVLGSVAAGGTAVQSRDYLADAELNHLPHIDSVVRGEGVRAIHGAPLRLDGQVQGALLIAQRRPTVFGPGVVRAVQAMAAMASMAWRLHRATEQVEGLRDRLDHLEEPELLEDVFAARPDSLRRLRRLGFSAQGRLTVLVVAVAAERQQQTMTRVRQLLPDTRMLVARHRGQVCVVLQGADPGPTAELLVSRLAELHPQIGWAHGSGLAEADRIQRRAHQALAVQQCLRTGPGHRGADELGIAALLIGGVSPEVVADLLDSHLAPLLGYDRDRGTQLTETAAEVLEHGASAAARALNIHVNTVGQRCERIGALLGADWRTPPRSVDLLFALRIWRLQGVLGSESE